MYSDIHGFDIENLWNTKESFMYNPFTKAKTFNANNGTVNYTNHTKGESKKRKQMAKRSRRINRK